jgi:hypothetical protein
VFLNKEKLDDFAELVEDYTKERWVPVGGVCISMDANRSPSEFIVAQSLTFTKEG